MDRLARHLLGLGWAVGELMLAAYDLVSRRDPNAELKRFMAAHPGLIIREVSARPPRPPA